MRSIPEPTTSSVMCWSFASVEATRPAPASLMLTRAVTQTTAAMTSPGRMAVRLGWCGS